LRIPACAAYWSHDPSGAEHLSAEEARNGGFPDIEFKMWAGWKSWDASVFAGIRQFQQAKGFNPYSQKVAIELQCPLYQVSCERNDLYAHCEPGISITVNSSDGLTVQASDTEDDYSDSNADNHFLHSEEQESGASDHRGIKFLISSLTN
jgi:hypothetical protein